MSARHSSGWVNSSPMAMGVTDCRTQLAEPVLVLRCHRVLQEEQPERLELLGQPHGVDGRQALVHVVQQLQLEAQPAAQGLEEPGTLRA